MIFVHELGHFIFAKKTGMLVEEFAIGFPPRIFSKQKGETKYSIGIIPLGGYCKILGEDLEEEEDKKEKNYNRRFTSQSKINQALVLAAGVAFNFLLAWLLFTITFMSGMPVSASQFEAGIIEDPALILLDVLPNTPAERAGLKIGDVVLHLSSEGKGIQNFKNTNIPSDFISSGKGKEIEILYKRGEETFLTTVTPQKDLISDKLAIGVSFDIVGTVKLDFIRSVWEGLKMTGVLIIAITVGLITFIWGIFTGVSSLAQISGPVGIVSMVGNAFEFGFVYLLSFVALISINLGVINLIPIPALDGGRLLFLAIEAIKGSTIKPKIANFLNFLGFVLLMILMLIVTVSDVFKLF